MVDKGHIWGMRGEHGGWEAFAWALAVDRFPQSTQPRERERERGLGFAQSAVCITQGANHCVEPGTGAPSTDWRNTIYGAAAALV